MSLISQPYMVRLRKQSSHVHHGFHWEQNP
uniref:CBL-interacting serine/threonine-protein kinase 8 n=1 Tax=Rhizophora mucronata TaxID=61149 RepID=A0A2P2KMA7_RHIMU